MSVEVVHIVGWVSLGIVAVCTGLFVAAAISLSNYRRSKRG